jgi:hypothetical protein
MHRRLPFILFILPLFLMLGCENQPSGPEYKLGDFQLRDRGPAGGWIFYIDEADEFDWTFLEAAPEDSDTQFHWGPQGTLVGTETGIGTGESNTDKIVAWLEDNNISGKAAQYCDLSTTGGYKDWFLPSEDELEKMFIELYKYDGNSNVGGFGGSRFYWCSSEVSANIATIRRPSDTDPWSSIKNYNYYVRPIRSF